MANGWPTVTRPGPTSQFRPSGALYAAPSGGYITPGTAFGHRPNLAAPANINRPIGQAGYPALNRLFSWAHKIISQRNKPILIGAGATAAAAVAYGYIHNPPAEQAEGWIAVPGGSSAPEGAVELENGLGWIEPQGGWDLVATMSDADAFGSTTADEWIEYGMGYTRSINPNFSSSYVGDENHPTGFWFYDWSQYIWEHTMYVLANVDLDSPLGRRYGFKHWYQRPVPGTSADALIHHQGAMPSATPKPIFFPNPDIIPQPLPMAVPTVPPELVPPRMPRPNRTRRDPFGVPLRGPRGTSRGRGQPGQGATFVVDPVSGVSTVSEPSGPRQEPPSGTRERKSQAHQNAVQVLGWALAVTEGVDLIEAVHQALPDHLQYSDDPIGMLEDIYQSFNQLDIEQAIYNIVYNQLEDAIIGFIGAGASNSLRNEFNRHTSMINLRA